MTKDAILVKEGVECTSTSGEVNFGKKNSLAECTQTCKDSTGCNYFIYGQGPKAGRCWSEGGVKSDDCGVGGYEKNSYNLYKLEDSMKATDKCTAAAVGFEASIATAQGWKAYQDSIACKVKVASESKATRDTAVKAYLKAI